MEGQPGPRDDEADIITQLQTQTNRLLNLCYNFVGALQRDAPACSIKGEAVDPGSSLDVQAQTVRRRN